MLAGGLIALALALVAGRAWCGWLCPLGTVLDWTPAHKPAPKEADLARRWRQAKYFLLGLILVAALLGNLSLMFLDPITLIYRTMASAVWPALVAIISGAERALVGLPVPGLQDAVVAFDNVLRGTVLPMYQPVYGLGGLAVLLFGAVLALNAVRARFWCRYLCPLGALLGLVSKVAWLRRTMSDSCIECARCARACPTGTIDAARELRQRPGRVHHVPRLRAGLRQGRPGVPRPPGAGGLAALRSLAAPVPCLGRRSRGRGGPGRGRAARRAAADVPGAPAGRHDPDFLAQCMRCGICLKVCPTSGLQPSLTTAGWSGLWTPVLVPRLGYCDFSCNACGQACPTGAIPPLALEEKRLTVIGHAYVDRDRCLPWASGRNCIACEEMCPLPEKAIQLEEVEAWTPGRSTVTLKRPHVVQERCIGCGICENRCPLSGQAAIRVYAPTDLGVVAAG